jgi:chromosome segregation ATPase
MKLKNDTLKKEIQQLRQDFLAVTRDLNSTRSHLEAILKQNPEAVPSKPEDKESTPPSDVIDRIMNENEALHRKVYELEEQIFELEKIGKDSHQGTIGEREEELTKARSLVSTLQNQIATQSAEMDRLLRRQKDLEAIKDDLSQKRKECLDESNAARRKCEQLHIVIRQHEGTIDQLNQDLVSVRHDRDALLKCVNQSSDEKDNDAVTSTQPSSPNKFVAINRDLQDGQTSLLHPKDNAKFDNERNAENEVGEENSTKIQDPPTDQKCARVDQEAQVNLPTPNPGTELLQTRLRLLEKEKQDWSVERQQWIKKIEDEKKKVCHTQGSVQAERAQEQKSPEDMRRLLAEVDRERDQWQHELDAKAEKIAELEAVLRSLRDREMLVASETRDLQDQIANYHAQLEERGHEIGRLVEELQSIGMQNEELRNQCTKAQTEIEHYRSDAGHVIRENEKLQQQLTEINAERNTWKEALDVEVQKAQCLERMVQTKETEKDQLMGTYRRLIQEHHETESLIQRLLDEKQSLELEFAAHRNESGSIQADKEKMTDEIKISQRELKKYRIQCQGKKMRFK